GGADHALKFHAESARETHVVRKARIMSRIKCAANTVGVVATAGSAVGQGHPTAGEARGSPEHVRAAERDGFGGRDGTQIDIGLEQVTSISGEIAYRSVLRALGPLDAPGAPEALGVLASIRENGIRIDPLQFDSGWITAIQNTLDGQSIEHQVIVNLELSRIPALRSDVGRALERALGDAAVPF